MKIEYTEYELEKKKNMIMPFAYDYSDIIKNNLTANNLEDIKDKENEAIKIDSVRENLSLAKSYILSAREIYNSIENIYKNGGTLVPVVVSGLYHQALEILLKSKLYEEGIALEMLRRKHDLSVIWKEALEKDCSAQTEYTKMYDKLKVLEENGNNSMAFRFTQNDWKDPKSTYWNKENDGIIYRNVNYYVSLAEQVYKELNTLEFHKTP